MPRPSFAGLFLAITDLLASRIPVQIRTPFILAEMDVEI
jgi:hypothetical protein